MIISAKFNTKCHKCGSPISVGEKIEWTPGAKNVWHVDTVLCNERKLRAMMVEKAAPVEKDMRLLPLLDMIKAVDLKRPTLRLRNGEDSIVISVTQGGHVPGSIAIKVNGVYSGCVRPNGEMTHHLTNNPKLQEYLLSVSISKEKLIEQAVLYGKFTNTCSFCGLELTHDYSVMVGYGPICAGKWDLPHAYNGTADNVPSGLSASAKRKYMELMMSEDDDEQTT
jgi:hypothetical protein